MGNPKRQSADEPPATIEEVTEAIAALTKGDLLRLRKYSHYRYRTLGRRGAGRNSDDLLSDALIDILEKRRKWKRSHVDFVKFLTGVIQSLSSHISEGKSIDAFDDVVSYVASDNDSDALDRLASSSAPTPHEELEAIELEQDAVGLDGRIRDHFRDDGHALMVYEGLCENMKPAEIRDCGLTVKEFDSARKRFERGVKKLVQGGQP